MKLYLIKLFKIIYLIFYRNKNRNKTRIFLISDGYVSNEEYTVNIIKENSKNVPVFTIGIGDKINKHFLRNLARTGGGSCFIIKPSYSKYQIETQLFHQLNQPLVNHWENIQILWGLHSTPNTDDEFGTNLANPNAPSKDCIQSPSVVHSIYTGDRLIVYYLSNNLVTSATIRAFSTVLPTQNQSFNSSLLSFDFESVSLFFYFLFIVLFLDIYF